MKQIRLKITNELLNLGYILSNIGTLYLIETIEILYNRKSHSNTFYSFNLEKDIYVILGKKYNSNIYTIKSTIIKATQNMVNNSVTNVNSIHIHWTPKVVIQYVLEKI